MSIVFMHSSLFFLRPVLSLVTRFFIMLAIHFHQWAFDTGTIQLAFFWVFSIFHLLASLPEYFAQNVAWSCGLSFEIQSRVPQLSGLRRRGGRWLHCLTGLCLSLLLSCSFPWQHSLAVVLWTGPLVMIGALCLLVGTWVTLIESLF